MKNRPPSVPQPGLAQRLLGHTCAGAAIGYAFLHPASVFIYDKLGTAYTSYLASFASAFDLDHIWMAGYFTFIGGAFGLIHGLNYHRMALLYEKVRNLSITDALTGLYNRRYLETCLRREGLRAERHKGELSLLMIDIDHFKHYNDTNGHPAGDRLLQTLALRLHTIARKSDIVTRYGGEEFIILMPDTPIPMAIRLAERLRRDIASFPFENRETQPGGKVTISIGCAQHIAGCGAGMDHLIRMADDCLYRAKNRGKNQVAYEGYAAKDKLSSVWINKSQTAA